MKIRPARAPSLRYDEKRHASENVQRRGLRIRSGRTPRLRSAASLQAATSRKLRSPLPRSAAPGEVLATADAALYEAKAMGKGLVAVLEHPTPPRSSSWKRENSGRIRLDAASRGPAGRGSRP